MLKDVHEFLTNNNISYSLCGGNLLGAIRHNGFIPWDDDVDIMMDRNNYNEFLKTYKHLKNYRVDKLLWVHRIQQKDRTNVNPWSIPTIDIFVIDNVPNNRLLFKIKVSLIRLLQNMMKKKPKKNKYSPLKRFVLYFTYYFGKMFTLSFKQKMYEKISSIGNKKSAEYVGCFNDLYSLINKKYHKDLMRDLELHSYEDTMLYITKHYDNYLTVAYGDYMTPPPETAQCPSHMS